MATFPVQILHPGFDLDVEVLSGLPLDFEPHRVVPIRFARAVSGIANAHAPDIDDHGFTVCAGGPAFGPSVGVIPGREIRIKVIRDRLGADVDLFVAVEDTSVATIEFPAAGTALSAADVPKGDDGPERQADCFYLKGAGGTAEASTKIHVRFGASDGPAVAELAVFLYPLLVIPTQLHEVTVNGTASGISGDDAKAVIVHANKILAQAGVFLRVLATVKAEAVTGLAVAGQVNSDTESGQIFDLHPSAAVLNIYYFQSFNDNTLGISNAPRFDATHKTGFQFAAIDNTGTALATTDLAETMAHELGHVLGLEHVANGQQGFNDAAGVHHPNTVRHDIWAHRCLMHNFSILRATTKHSSAARVQVGYGLYPSGLIRAGNLLMSKNRPGIPLSGEIRTVRDAATSGAYKP